MVDQCSTVKYPLNWGFKREPIRPLNLRIDYYGMKFNDNFDWDNIWYDAIQINDTTILLIGPPLYSTKDWLLNNIKFVENITVNDNALSFRFIELDRVCYTIITVSKRVNFIDMIKPYDTSVRIKVNHNTGIFNGKTAMVTMQKNNPISWIKQWITYHHQILNVNAFLIYDNNSTLYSIKELEIALEGLGPSITIVNWPYLHGPQGSDFSPWDSDFGPYVMLEHAKLRYLSNAKLVLNNDLDEIIVTKGITLDDITNYLKNNNVQCLRYKGTWVQPYDIANNQSADQIPCDIRHIKNYYCTDSNFNVGIGYKWMLVPSNTTVNQQWLLHNINGQTLETNQIHYYHYLSHNTNWQWKRDTFKGNVNDLVINQDLLDNLNKME